MQSAIESFLRTLRIEKNVAALTLKSYAEDLESFTIFLQERLGQVPDPAEITVAVLRAYVSYLHECQYAKTTIARRLACLRSFFRYCCREGLTPNNPAKALRTPRAGRKLPHFLTTPQVARLLETPPANKDMGLRDRAILETIYSAGLRVAELVGSNVRDWDRDANVLRVLGKGRKERIAPLGSYAVKALHRWMEVRKPHPSDPTPIFLNKYGKRLTTRSIGR